MENHPLEARLTAIEILLFAITKQLNAEALKESFDNEKALAITSLKKNETFRAETLVSVEKHLSFFETILSANCVADKIPDHNS